MSRDMNLTYTMAAVGAAGVMTAIGSATKSLNELKDSTESLKKAQKKLENLDKIKNSYVSVNKEYVEAVRNLSKLKEEYSKAGSSNAVFAKGIKETEKHIEKLNKQKERQKHLFRSARSELEKEGIYLQNYKKKLDEVNRSLKQYGALKEKAMKYSELGANFSEKGTNQMRRGVIVGAAALVPIKFYADLEESQADLKKMIDFRDKTEENAYFEKIRVLSESSPLKQTEVYEIAGSAAQAGIAKEDIVAFTERAMKLKVAFDMSTEASGKFLAKTKSQLGLTQQATFEFADTINYLSDNSAAEAAELAEVSSRIGGLAKSQNIAKETNMGLATSLLATGKTAEVASTGLKQLYLELAKGGDTKRKIAAFDYIGIDSRTINEDMARDAEGTIVKVLEKIKNLKDADRSAVLNDLFGEQAIDSVSTLATNIDDVRKNLKLAHSEMTKGAVDREYANRMSTLTNTFKQTFNTLMNALMDIGKSVAPELKETLEWIKSVFSSLGNWIKKHPKLTAFIIKTVGAFALFNLTLGALNKVAIGPFFKMLSWITKFQGEKAILGLGGAFKKMMPLTSGAFGLLMKLARGVKIVGLAMKAFLVANPIVLIIAAVVAVIAIFVVLYRKVEWFRNGVIKIFEGIKLWFGGIWDIIRGIFTGNFDLIKQGFQKMVDGIKSIWEGLTGIIGNTWDKITGIFKTTKEKTEEIKKMGEKSQPVSRMSDRSSAVRLVSQKSKGFRSRSIPQHWTGTSYFTGGLTSIAERGPELVKFNNSTYLASTPSIVNLPKGTEIFNSSETRKSLVDKIKTANTELHNIKNSNQNTTIGGDTITIEIYGRNDSATDIAKEVKKVLMELQSKKKRTVII